MPVRMIPVNEGAMVSWNIIKSGRCGYNWCTNHRRAL
jgi:hypothetical protein